jgi:hypothetical protein
VPPASPLLLLPLLLLDELQLPQVRLHLPELLRGLRWGVAWVHVLHHSITHVLLAIATSCC